MSWYPQRGQIRRLTRALNQSTGEYTNTPANYGDPLKCRIEQGRGRVMSGNHGHQLSYDAICFTPRGASALREATKDNQADELVVNGVTYKVLHIANDTGFSQTPADTVYLETVS